MQVKNNNRGSVSIYIILMFAVLLSFILLIVEGARKNAIRLKTECAMDLSMSSALGEYNRELLEQYDMEESRQLLIIQRNILRVILLKILKFQVTCPRICSDLRQNRC